MWRGRQSTMTMPPSIPGLRVGVGAVVMLTAVVLSVSPAGAQRAPQAAAGLPALQTSEVPARVLTLDTVIDLAEARSEQIAIAQFGVDRALAGERRARSDRLPQLSGGASYDRLLKSEFSGLFSGDSGDGGFGGDFSNLKVIHHC